MEPMKAIVEKFIAWAKLKIRIHVRDPVRDVFFREREIWWVHLGKNIGHEEDGKHEQFERPSVILRKFSQHLFLGVPTSTQQKLENPFYHSFLFRGQRYSAILSQMRPMSSKRLIRKIGTLPRSEWSTLKWKICELIKNDSRIS